jgi:hypothetical protein
MIYDKALAVASLRPYKAWSWAGEDYSNFIWQDSGTAPTEDEINAELTRLTNEEPMRLLRLERNKRLTACDWIITMHKELGTNIPAAWKTYRQALRDLPASANPTVDTRGELDLTSVTFPTEPS